MKQTIQYLESLFVSESDSHYTPEEREKHNKAIQRAIDALRAVAAADTAFEMISIHGYDEKLSPQAVQAINEAFPLVRIARFGKENIDKDDLKKFALSLLDDLDLREGLKSHGKVVVVWGIDDIKSTASELNLELTEDEISRVMSALEHHHDATVGINWEVISYTIESVINETRKS